MNEADCRRLAEHLEIKELDDFLQQYTKSYARKAGWWLLRSVGESQVNTCYTLQLYTSNSSQNVRCAGVQYLCNL